ncbi:MAG TPA: ABC transporter substrate-binding protein [Thermomicrobiales bacterium]|nr:ABC transporter substrate-binding protein [Thermomicrobiales bacterium]
MTASAGVSAALFNLTGPSPWGRAVVAQDGAREFHAAWPYLAPPQGHFNAFVTNAIMMPPNIYGDMIWQPFALYNWGSQEWMPIMATSWSFINSSDMSSATPAASPVADDPAAFAEIAPIADGADTFQVRIREGASWDDGNPFTVQDVLTTFTIRRLMSDVVWSYIDNVEAIDDYTVNFHMSNPSTIVQRYILRTSTQSHALYGEWATRAQELFDSGKTVDDPEGAQLLQEFVQFRPEGVIANGPFTMDIASITNAEMTLVKNETAWNADQVQFDRIRDFNGRGDTIIGIILEGSVDYGTQAFPPAVEEQMIADGFRIVRPPIYSGPSIAFNHTKFPEFNDKRVRQAMAHAIDREQNAFIAMGQSGLPPQYMAGMSDNHVTTWMDEADISELDAYAYDPQRATALLEEAGWTKPGDVWLTPEGREAEYEITWPSEYPDWSAAGNDATEQLNDFGFRISSYPVTAEQQPIDVDQGRFDLAIVGWGNSNNPHPHFSYTQAFFTHNTLAINNGGEGTGFPLVQETADGEEVNLEELTISSARGMDTEAQRADIAVIAKVYNDLLPRIPLWERYGNNSIIEGERSGPWPPDDDPIYQNSPYADGIVTMLMLQGRIGPAE